MKALDLCVGCFFCMGVSKGFSKSFWGDQRGEIWFPPLKTRKTTYFW